MQNAVVSAENRTFWTDPGLDPKGIVRAAWNNLTCGATQGASTITQQYVKLLYLSQQRTWTRKIEEAFISVKIDQELSKQQILDGYLNTIYFGRGAYGIDAAAEAYFREPASQLTIPQSAVLASVLNSPSNLDPGVSKSNAPAAARPLPLRPQRDAADGQLERLRRRRATSSGFPRSPDPSTRDQYAGERGFLMTMVQSALTRHGFTPQQIYGGGSEDRHDVQLPRHARRAEGGHARSGPRASCSCTSGWPAWSPAPGRSGPSSAAGTTWAAS